MTDSNFSLNQTASNQSIAYGCHITAAHWHHLNRYYSEFPDRAPTAQQTQSQHPPPARWKAIAQGRSQESFHTENHTGEKCTYLNIDEPTALVKPLITCPVFFSVETKDSTFIAQHDGNMSCMGAVKIVTLHVFHPRRLNHNGLSALFVLINVPGTGNYICETAKHMGKNGYNWTKQHTSTDRNNITKFVLASPIDITNKC